MLSASNAKDKLAAEAEFNNAYEAIVHQEQKVKVPSQSQAQEIVDATMPSGPEFEPDNKKPENIPLWDMPKHGKIIGGRYYTKHALERMAPYTPQVRAELERRAITFGYKIGGREFYNYVKPRGIPPSVIEDAIQSAKPIQNNTGETIVYVTDSVKVITNKHGDVITVFKQ